MDYQPTDNQQLDLFQVKTEEELWGAAWYWVWLSRELNKSKR
jgi:hypothetical protein